MDGKEKIGEILAVPNSTVRLNLPPRQKAGWTGLSRMA
jgi:hypothetical protein